VRQTFERYGAGRSGGQRLNSSCTVGGLGDESLRRTAVSFWSDRRTPSEGLFDNRAKYAGGIGVCGGCDVWRWTLVTEHRVTSAVRLEHEPLGLLRCCDYGVDGAVRGSGTAFCDGPTGWRRAPPHRALALAANACTCAALPPARTTCTPALHRTHPIWVSLSPVSAWLSSPCLLCWEGYGIGLLPLT